MTSLELDLDLGYIRLLYDILHESDIDLHADGWRDRIKIYIAC